LVVEVGDLFSWRSLCKERVDMAEKPSSRQGRIGTATLPEVVRDLWRARASGTLHLDNGPHTKRISFRKGDIIFAATNVETERLGERLVRDGKVKRATLELAFRVMERSHKRLGTTMVEWGWVSPVEMRRAVATQIKDIIYSVFTWSSGEYRFEPEPEAEPVPEDLVLELRTAELIYEGARRQSDLLAIRAGVGSPSATLVLSDGTRLGIPVTQEDGYILARVDGRTSILDIVSVSPLGEEETLRRIYALLLAGVLERKQRPATSSPAPDAMALARSNEEKRFRDGIIARHAAMKFGNCYDRLGVVLGATEKQVREGHAQILSSLVPDPSFRDRLSDLQKRMDEVRRNVDEAHDILADPARRREYDRALSGVSSESTLSAEVDSARTIAASPKPRPKPKPEPEPALEPTPAPVTRGPAPRTEASAKRRQEAELYYLEANRFWQDGDYFDAIAAINESVRLDPRKAVYHRVLGRWLAENPSCAEAAREELERAIALDPGDREAYLELAHLLESEGEPEHAKGIYEKLASLPEEAVKGAPGR
jgi:tetratricopeptide (TPR) repeat protein